MSEFKEGDNFIIGKTEFPNIKTVQDIVDSLNENEKKQGVFCPLLMKTCRTDCAAFQKAVVGLKPHPDNVDENMYVVLGYHCKSPMINGYEKMPKIGL